MPSRLLQTPAVRKAIDEAPDAASKRAGVEKDVLLKELSCLLTSSIDYYQIGESGRSCSDSATTC